MMLKGGRLLKELFVQHKKDFSVINGARRCILSDQNTNKMKANII